MSITFLINSREQMGSVQFVNGIELWYKSRVVPMRLQRCLRPLFLSKNMVICLVLIRMIIVYYTTHMYKSAK